MAKAKSIAASEAECDAAVYLYLFGSHLRNGDLSKCAEVAQQAFELCREDTTHCVDHKTWVETLLEASQNEQADDAALRYLQYLHREDKTSKFIRKRVGFLAAVVRPNAARMPNAALYLSSSFTEAEIEAPLVIYKGLRDALRARPQSPADQE